MMLESGASLVLPERQATHRVNITSCRCATPDNRSFTVVFSGTTEELKNYIKTRFEQKLLAQLKPDIVFMNEDVVRTTHTITASRLRPQEKAFSFSVCCPSRTADEVLTAIRQDIVDGGA